MSQDLGYQKHPDDKDSFLRNIFPNVDLFWGFVKLQELVRLYETVVFTN